MLAGIRAAVLGDQVDVLDDHHRRLQRSRDRARLGDEVQGGAGQLHDRDPRRAREQVAHGVRLAGARRTVQQEPALEVLAAGEQPLAVAPDADDLPLDRGQHAVGQDQRRGVHVRAGVEVRERVPGAEDLGAERQHLSAEDVVRERQRADLGRDPRGCPRGGADDLERDALVRAVALGATHQQRGPVVAVGHQVQRARDARADLAVRSARDVDGRDVAGSRAVGIERAGDGEQVRQPELAVLEARDADDVVPPVRSGEPGVEPCLDIHVVVGEPGLLHDGDIGRDRAEMLVQAAGQSRREVRARRAHHRAHPAPGEPADVGQLRSQGRPRHLRLPGGRRCVREPAESRVACHLVHLRPQLASQ